MGQSLAWFGQDQARDRDYNLFFPLLSSNPQQSLAPLRGAEPGFSLTPGEGQQTVGVPWIEKCSPSPPPQCPNCKCLGVGGEGLAGGMWVVWTGGGLALVCAS